jgi:dipeptidyl-peptidase-4
MRAQRLCQSGYVVLLCDNRGSSCRGLHFEGAIKHFLGGVEVKDQCAAVAHFVGRGLIDPKRVGIYGWSYGVSFQQF